MANKKGRTKKMTAKTKSLPKRDYTEEEKQRLARYEEGTRNKCVKFKAIGDDPEEAQITIEDLDDPLLKVKLSEAFGMTDADVQGYLLDQVVKIFSGTYSADSHNNEAIATAANRAVAILAGIQPQDELEAMLAVQMIGVHNMALDTLKRAILGGQTFEGKQANVNQATKMLRTYVAQMEALKQYKTGGQQKMVIEHVHVNDSGRAIVGTVSQGGGVNDKNNG